MSGLRDCSWLIWFGLVSNEFLDGILVTGWWRLPISVRCAALCSATSSERPTSSKTRPSKTCSTSSMSIRSSFFFKCNYFVSNWFDDGRCCWQDSYIDFQEFHFCWKYWIKPVSTKSINLMLNWINNLCKQGDDFKLESVVSSNGCCAQQCLLPACLNSAIKMKITSTKNSLNRGESIAATWRVYFRCCWSIGASVIGCLPSWAVALACSTQSSRRGRKDFLKCIIKY